MSKMTMMQWRATHTYQDWPLSKIWGYGLGSVNNEFLNHNLSGGVEKSELLLAAGHSLTVELQSYERNYTTNV